MNFNHLYYFHVIASEGTLSRAAKALNLSQSTLSTQLKSLEDSLETQLFDRKGGALKLNARGQKALEITREIFRLADRLEEIFPGGRRPVKVRLDVGICTTVSRSITLDRFVELFQNEEILTRIRQGDDEYLTHELLSSGLDLVISDTIPNRADERGVDHRVIARPVFVIIAGHELADSMTEETAAGLHDQPFIHYTSHSSYRFEIDQFFRDGKIEPRVVAEADDVYVIRDAVRANVGFAIVPATALPPEGDPEVRTIGTVDREFLIYALYNRQDPSEEVMRALKILSGEDLEKSAGNGD